MPDRGAVLLDACSLIALFATRKIETILASRPDRFCIVDIVREESGFVLRGGDEADANDREPIDLWAMEASGLIVTLSATGESELLTYLDLRQQVGDGEAMTGAIAIHRGYKVITDDRKALRILGETGVECETTLDLIKLWAERDDVSREELRVVLLDLRQRARYVPHRQHPLRDWWDTLLS